MTIHAGLGWDETRLSNYDYRDRWLPIKSNRQFTRSQIEEDLAVLPATPDATAILQAIEILDDFIKFGWIKENRSGEFHNYARSDVRELLTLNTPEHLIPGVRWIVDLFERLGWGEYSRWRNGRKFGSHLTPEDLTPAEIRKLVRRFNHAPKTDIERLILVSQFERMSLSLRVRLAPLVA